MTVRLKTRHGREIKELRVNEDSFTIQVRDGAGRFESFEKKDLASVEHLPAESLMPSYKGRLPADEIDDLVAYLAGLK